MGQADLEDRADSQTIFNKEDTSRDSHHSPHNNRPHRRDSIKTTHQTPTNSLNHPRGSHSHPSNQASSREAGGNNQGHRQDNKPMEASRSKLMDNRQQQTATADSGDQCPRPHRPRPRPCPSLQLRLAMVHTDNLLSPRVHSPMILVNLASLHPMLPQLTRVIVRTEPLRLQQGYPTPTHNQHQLESRLNQGPLQEDMVMQLEDLGVWHSPPGVTRDKEMLNQPMAHHRLPVATREQELRGHKATIRTDAEAITKSVIFINYLHCHRSCVVNSARVCFINSSMQIIG